MELDCYAIGALFAVERCEKEGCRVTDEWKIRLLRTVDGDPIIYRLVRSHRRQIHDDVMSIGTGSGARLDGLGVGEDAGADQYES
jgi:hypothetical protein